MYFSRRSASIAVLQRAPNARKNESVCLFHPNRADFSNLGLALERYWMLPFCTA
jgi:hypothetical protein